MTRRGPDDYHGGGSGWRFAWRPERMRSLHELGQSFGMTEDSVPRLSGGGGRLIEVVVFAVKPDPESNQLELTVRDRRTGRDGTILVEASEFRGLVGDCHSHELLRVAVDRIVWKD